MNANKKQPRPRKLIIERTPEPDESTNVATPYGTVNRRVLYKLQDTFETMRILRAVDLLDEVRYRLGEPDQIRQELLNLHGMALDLINGGGNPAPRTAAPIWELADELRFELFQHTERLEKIQRLLDKIAKLAPVDELGNEET